MRSWVTTWRGAGDMGRLGERFAQRGDGPIATMAEEDAVEILRVLIP